MLVRDILISLFIISIILIIKSKNKNIVSLYSAVIILFSMSMIIIFYLTGISPMSGFHIDIRINEISIVPFEGISRMLKGGISRHAIINIFGNIIMFMPVGFLVPLLSKKLDSYKYIALFGFGISFIIEFTQLFLVRGTDIDDLILNTFGTVLGYLIFILFKNVFDRLIQKIITESKYVPNNLILAVTVVIPYVVIIICGFYDRLVL